MERTTEIGDDVRIPWWRTWLLVAACTVAGVIFLLVNIALELEWFHDDPPEMLAWITLIDLIFGLAALSLVALIQRYQSLTLALVLVTLAGLSPMATPAATYAVARTTARRSRWPMWLTPVVGAVAAVSGYALFEFLLGRTFDWLIVPTAVLVYGLPTVWGLVSRSRADTLRALRREAAVARREQLAAQHEQEYRLAQATLAERNRLAREVHDALSHELALISMHAGALEFRDDLSPEQRADATAVVAAAARRAGSELRRVILALRDSEVMVPPSLADLPELLAELRAAGMTIVDQFDQDLIPSLPVSLSQQLYRAARECLHNAHRHAPGAPVSLLLTRRSAGIALECRNPPGGEAAATTGTGTGLLGLAESARLQQGTFDHAVIHGEFVARMWLPWQV